MAAISRSTPGTIWGMISRMVTSEPKAFRSWASSTPMKPPPMMTVRAGVLSMPRMSSLFHAPADSRPSIGGQEGFEPVAMRMHSVAIFSSVSRTRTVLESTNSAVPFRTLIFFAARRLPTPFESLSTTAAFLFMTVLKSSSTPLTRTPKVSDSRMRAMVSAD